MQPFRQGSLMQANFRGLGLLLLAFKHVAAEEVVYVTDLSIYTYLAGCASNAIAVNIADQTRSSVCPEAVTDLQSCVCNTQYDEVSSRMSGMISATCGSTASEDQASASTVLSAYCNQETEVAFPTPEYPVSSYIHELAAFTELAPCASGALSLLMRAKTEVLCPPDPTALAPCVCEKNQNSLRVSAEINTRIQVACSSNKEDTKSAQDLFAAYCNMNKGTTSLPEATPPPGDMSYYITDIPQYSSLESCAKSGVLIGAMYQTTSLCPTDGPEALASCVCLKDNVSKSVSSDLTFEIRQRCFTGVNDNLSSANAVLDYYCSAARDEVTATGIMATSTSERPSRPMATETSPSDSDNGSSSGISAGAIAGAVVGAVGGFIAVCLAIFFLMRRRNRGEKSSSAHTEAHTSNPGLATAYQPVRREEGPRHDTISPVHSDDECAPPPYEPGPHAKASKKV